MFERYSNNIVARINDIYYVYYHLLAVSSRHYTYICIYMTEPVDRKGCVV